jgi:hypothetical protein
MAVLMIKRPRTGQNMLTGSAARDRSTAIEIGPIL